MDGLDRDALDRWITGGRYSSCAMQVTCPACGEETFVVSETEYGSTEWNPAECGNKACGREFTGDEDWREDEPPEPEYNYDLD